MRDVIRVITDEEDWVQVKIGCYLLEPLLDTSRGVYPRKGGFLTGVDWEWVKPFWIGSVEGYLEDILEVHQSLAMARGWKSLGMCMSLPSLVHRMNDVISLHLGQKWQQEKAEAEVLIPDALRSSSRKDTSETPPEEEIVKKKALVSLFSAKVPCWFWTDDSCFINLEAMDSENPGELLGALVHVCIRGGYRLLIRAEYQNNVQLLSLFTSLKEAYAKIEELKMVLGEEEYCIGPRGEYHRQWWTKSQCAPDHDNHIFDLQKGARVLVVTSSRCEDAVSYTHLTLPTNREV